jgi:hypothetical protein
MLLNSDTIKDKNFTFNKNDEYFFDGEQRIEFENITSYYHQETSQTTNNIYEGTKLRVVLHIKYFQKPYIIEIDSKKEEKYKLVYTLSFAIAQYRKKKILEELAFKKKVVFQTQNYFVLEFEESGTLKLIYQDKKSYYQPFMVQKVKLEKHLITFIGADKSEEEFIYAYTISDISLFFELMSAQSYFSDETLAKEKRETKLSYMLMILIVLFGVNGYFEACCMENDFVEFVSDISLFLVKLTLLLAPFGIIAHLVNNKKKQKEMKNLMEALDEK